MAAAVDFHDRSELVEHRLRFFMAEVAGFLNI